jgi:putative addiction module CopG family antidote
MRTIMNISLSPQLGSIVEAEVKSGKYASKSEFIRSLLRNYAETKLAGELEESRSELNSGRGKLLKSLSDLD